MSPTFRKGAKGKTPVPEGRKEKIRADKRSEDQTIQIPLARQTVTVELETREEFEAARSAARVAFIFDDVYIRVENRPDEEGEIEKIDAPGKAGLKRGDRVVVSFHYEDQWETKIGKVLPRL